MNANREVLYVNIAEYHKRQLENLAEQNDKTLSEYVREMIRNHIRENAE